MSAFAVGDLAVGHRSWSPQAAGAGTKVKDSGPLGRAEPLFRARRGAMVRPVVQRSAGLLHAGCAVEGEELWD